MSFFKNLLLLLLVYTPAFSLAVKCRDIVVPFNKDKLCVNIIVGKASLDLYPSFIWSQLIVNDEYTSETFDLLNHSDNVFIAGYVLRWPVIFNSDTVPVCDGILPLGKYSPMWNIWKLVIVKQNLLHFLCEGDDRLFTTEHDLWQINGENYTSIVNLSDGDQTVVQTELSYAVSLPMIPELLTEDIKISFLVGRTMLYNSTYYYLQRYSGPTYTFSTRRNPELFSYVPFALQKYNSNHIYVNRNIIRFLAVMVEGHTQRARCFSTGSYTTSNVEINFNIITNNVIQLLHAFWFFYRLYKAGYGTPTAFTANFIFMNENNSKISRFIRSTVYLVFLLSCVIHAFVNSYALEWEQHFCYIAGICLEPYSLLILVCCLAIGGMIVIRFIDGIYGEEHEGDFVPTLSHFHFQIILTLWISFSYIPLASSEKHFFMWFFSSTIALLTLNYDANAIIYYFIVNHLFNALIIVVLLLTVFVNIIIGLCVAYPTFEFMNGVHGNTPVWVVVYMFIVLVQLPLLFVLNMRMNFIEHTNKKIK